MNKRLENISGWLLGIGLIGHICGYFLWSFITIINIYYVSLYFLLVNCGLVAMVLGRGKIMKVVSVALFSFAGQFLIMEFMGNPQDWSNRDLVILGMNFGSAMIISSLISNYKKKYNYE